MKFINMFIVLFMINLMMSIFTNPAYPILGSVYGDAEALNVTNITWYTATNVTNLSENVTGISLSSSGFSVLGFDIGASISIMLILIRAFIMTIVPLPQLIQWMIPGTDFYMASLMVAPVWIAYAWFMLQLLLNRSGGSIE